MTLPKVIRDYIPRNESCEAFFIHPISVQETNNGKTTVRKKHNIMLSHYYI
jgi:hypothetical protein